MHYYVVWKNRVLILMLIGIYLFTDYRYEMMIMVIMVITKKPRYAKLNMDIFARRQDPDSWVEINSSFRG